MKMEFKSNKNQILSQIEKGKLDTLEQIGELISSQAAANAPVDTGELSNSYSYLVDGEELSVGSSAEHSIPVELGTSKQPAQPHLVPALEQNMDKIAAVAKEALKIK